jgi:hypothetical protein
MDGDTTTPTLHPSRVDGQASAPAETPNGNGHAHTATDGDNEAPQAAETLAIVATAAERLGRVTFSSLADELGIGTSAARQHVRPLRSDGRLRVAASQPGSPSVFEWIHDSAGEPLVPEPEPELAATG